jgi:hypothetical protein
MRKRRLWLFVAVIVVLVCGWYWFRPELLFIDQTVNEDFPAPNIESKLGEHSIPTNGSVLLSSGKFHSVAHETIGSAEIYRLDDGRRVVRLKDFATSNGPDVRLYLISAPDAADSTTVKAGDFIELGRLKGNKGDQNYAIDPDVNLDRYRAVTIWCKRFSVNFGTAPLVRPD